MFWKKKDEAKTAAQPAAATPAQTQGGAGANPATAVAARPLQQPNAVATSGPAAGAHSHLSTQQALSSTLALALGKVVSVMMFSPRHQSLTVRDIATAIVPAIAANQFVVAEARQKPADGAAEVTAPVGVLLWARVSDDVDRRFTADPAKPTQLAAAEWTSGDNYWVIETIGAPKVVEAMMKELMDGPFKGRAMKFRMTDASGRHSIQTLDQRAA